MRHTSAAVRAFSMSRRVPGMLREVRPRGVLRSWPWTFLSRCSCSRVTRRPDLDFRQGDAERLEFADRSVDAVVMNFGLLHLSNPDLALREAHRVLRSGGWLAFTVWARPTEAVVFGIVLEAIERHGDLSVPLPPGPPFFRFSDDGECRAALLSAGFDTVTIKRIPQIWRLESVDRLFTAMLGATVRTGGLLRAQTPAAHYRIRRAVSEEVGRYRSGDRVALPMPAVLAAATARK